MLQSGFRYSLPTIVFAASRQSNDRNKGPSSIYSSCKIAITLIRNEILERRNPKACANATLSRRSPLVVGAS
jgi:hypothetical protein